MWARERRAARSTFPYSSCPSRRSSKIVACAVSSSSRSDSAHSRASLRLRPSSCATSLCIATSARSFCSRPSLSSLPSCSFSVCRSLHFCMSFFPARLPAENCDASSSACASFSRACASFTCSRSRRISAFTAGSSSSDSACVCAGCSAPQLEQLLLHRVVALPLLREPQHERALLPPLRRELLLQFALGLAELVDVVVRRSSSRARLLIAADVGRRGRKFDAARSRRERRSDAACRAARGSDAAAARSRELATSRVGSSHRRGCYAAQIAESRAVIQPF